MLRARLGEPPQGGGAPLPPSADALSRRSPAPLASGRRVDGSTGRLGGERFGQAAGSSSWLTENELAGFLSKAAPGERAGDAGGDIGVAPEDEGAVRRRTVLGVAAAVVFCALALRPDTSPPPPKPLFLYLAPLQRCGPLLARARAAAEDADWVALRAARAAVLADNEARANLAAAAAALPGPQRQAAGRAAASALLEAVDVADYASFFDTRATPTGAQNAEFAAFSVRALDAAQARHAGKGLHDWVKAMPHHALRQCCAGAAGRVPGSLSDGGPGRSQGGGGGAGRRVWGLKSGLCLGDSAISHPACQCHQPSCMQPCEWRWFRSLRNVVPTDESAGGGSRKRRRRLPLVAAHLLEPVSRSNPRAVDARARMRKNRVEAREKVAIGPFSPQQGWTDVGPSPPRPPKTTTARARRRATAATGTGQRGPAGVRHRPSHHIPATPGHPGDVGQGGKTSAARRSRESCASVERCVVTWSRPLRLAGGGGSGMAPPARTAARPR